MPRHHPENYPAQPSPRSSRRANHRRQSSPSRSAPFFFAGTWDSWAPVGSLLSGADDDNQRYIRHDLTWEPTALVSYTVDSTFEIKLILNDSNNSALGPGIYLDIDNIVFNSNLPSPFGNWYAPLLSPYEKIFIARSYAPATLIPNQKYFAQFTSLQPGKADQDNGELTINHTKNECWILCSSGAYCYIHDKPFGIAPIPGRIDWIPAPNRCTEWGYSFLPFLRN